MQIQNLVSFLLPIRQTGFEILPLNLRRFGMRTFVPHEHPGGAHGDGSSMLLCDQPEIFC